MTDAEGRHRGAPVSSEAAAEAARASEAAKEAVADASVPEPGPRQLGAASPAVDPLADLDPNRDTSGDRAKHE